MSGRLSGKVALISGAARGQGAAHVRAFLEEGARVVFGDILHEEGDDLAHALGSDARYVPLDVRDDTQWHAAVHTAVDAFGHLDVLVNNAGVLVAGDLETMDDATWSLPIDVNLTGTFRGIRAALPELRRSAPGSIVNVSSTAGIMGFPGMAAYNASKFGLRGLTRVAALELAPVGIRVNSVHPGNVATPMIDHLDDFAQVPQLRAADPGEISPLIIYLASDESSFVTGSEFVIDGGESAGHPLPRDTAR